MKKIICLLLSVLLLISSFGAITAFAEESEVSYLVESEKNNDQTRYVYYPKELKDTTKVYPLIVWANATGFEATNNLQLFDMIIREGYIIVASSEKFAGDGTDQIASLDYILGRNKKAGDKFYKRISTTNITALGHSQGGMSTVNACAKDNRFACAISISGNSSTSEAIKLSTPTLFFTGTKDRIVSSSRYVKPAYDNCKGPAVYASLIDGGHTACWDSGNPKAYANYILKWINAWNNKNSTALNAFKNGGELQSDSEWQDFACKNLTTVFKAKATISQIKHVYNGSVRMPTISVTDTNGNVIPQVNYTITYDSGRKNVGKYNVVVKMKNNYTGTITKSFTIAPKATKISKLTPTKKGFKATWKKQATQTNGYQIQYSTKSNFSSAKTVTISKKSATSKSFSKLKAKKKYFVRIRTYKTVSGKKYYSSWSAKKSVITKK